jgi:hypothetical protein
MAAQTIWCQQDGFVEFRDSEGISKLAESEVLISARFWVADSD